jgi:site-specific DNA-cytosine methylase
VVSVLLAAEKSGQQQQAVIAFHATQDPISSSAVTPSLGVTQGSAAIYDARGNGTGSVDTTLPGDHLNRITDYTPVVMRQREGKAGGGKGPLVSDKDLSLTATSDQILFTQQALGEYADKGVASSIKERDHKDATDLVLVVAPIATVRPRRLMPIECERLMGWPDRWTERGIDEQGRDYALSDSARYKLCGNGVASPVAGWIGWRLRDTLEALR